jgi:hypothetical protein
MAPLACLPRRKAYAPTSRQGRGKADCDILVSRMKRIRPFLGIAIGLIALANIALNPRFQVLRTVDKLALTGCGMCIGVALVTVFALVSRRG